MINTILLKLGILFLRKVRFRYWSELEDKKYAWIQAVEDNSVDFPKKFLDYLSTALPFNVNFSNVFWMNSITAFYKIHSVNSLSQNIPLTSRKSNRKNKKDDWDYPGRLWYFYCNTIASEYGWEEKIIANLDVDDAIAYIQEIFTNQYLEKEFIWSTADVSYVYNETTKKSNHVSLPKPYWMLPDKNMGSNRKVAPIPKSLLPVGNGINLNEI